jgi:hypothetical protein
MTYGQWGKCPFAPLPLCPIGFGSGAAACEYAGERPHLARSCPDRAIRATQEPMRQPWYGGGLFAIKGTQRKRNLRGLPVRPPRG